MPKKPPATHGGRRPGAGRPKMYKRAAAPTSVLLEQALLDKLDKRAAKLGITRTAAVQAAIQEWLG